MRKVITNTGRNAMYVGNACIPPGETKEVDTALVSEHGPSPDVPVTEDNETEDEPVSGTVEDLSGSTLSDIAVALPTLDDADLVTLARLEEEKRSPRKRLLSMISEEQLNRASAKAENPSA